MHSHRIRFLGSLCGLVLAAGAQAQKLVPNGNNHYQGAFVDFGDFGDEVSSRDLLAYQVQVGQPLTWGYFSDPWRDGNIRFPHANVQACDQAGVIPYIRMMPWSRLVEGAGADPVFSLSKIVAGDFDEPLSAWADAAKAWGKPLLVEFGPEMNGNWFPWNGQWHGAGRTRGYGDPNLPDGPEKFRDSYRHIIDLFRSRGVDNVTWMFHLDAAQVPNTWWNRVEYYYPGADYIDWVGLSVFGAQLPTHRWRQFSAKLEDRAAEAAAIADGKPMFVAEFAVVELRGESQGKAAWLGRAFDTLQSPENSSFAGFSYWNSLGYRSDGSADMRISSTPQALKAFQRGAAELGVATEARFDDGSIKELESSPQVTKWLPKQIINRQGVDVDYVDFSKLQSLDQAGDQSDASKYWDLLPQMESYSLVLQLELQGSQHNAKQSFVVAQVRGYDHARQNLKIEMQLADGSWQQVGENTEAKDWRWTTLSWQLAEIPTASKISLRLSSTRAIENFFLDYLAVEAY